MFVGRILHAKYLHFFLLFVNFHQLSLESNCDFLSQLSRGDKQWAQVAVETVQEQCLQQLERDVATWKVGTGGQLLPPSSVLEQLCPKDCSGNGRCEAGEKLNRLFVFQDYVNSIRCMHAYLHMCMCIKYVCANIHACVCLYFSV